MRFARAAILAAALVLAGCAHRPTVVAVSPALPALPGNLAARCPLPDVRSGAGSDAVVELARQRQALASCARRKADLTAFYQDIREGLAK